MQHCTNGQCQGITIKGAPCKKCATKGGLYCFLHKNTAKEEKKRGQAKKIQPKPKPLPVVKSVKTASRFMEEEEHLPPSAFEMPSPKPKVIEPEEIKSAAQLAVEARSIKRAHLLPPKTKPLKKKTAAERAKEEKAKKGPVAREVKTERSKFFQDVIQMNEKAWRENKDLIKKSITQDAHKIFYLKNKNGETFQAGAYELYSLGKLRQATKSLKSNKRGTFSVIDGLAKEFVDIGCLQSKPENRDAVFQVASNFNGLETTEAKADVGKQFLERYIEDKTQGPAASISAAPGLILRNYYYNWNPQTSPFTWRQTTKSSLNLLEDISDLTMTRGGYVKFDKVVKKKKYPKEEDLEKMKILYHHSIQVTHGCMFSDKIHYKINDPDQIVNQVLVAAADWRTNKNYINDQAALDWAYTLIQLAFEGTLRIAALKKKKKVFLTLVGGGAFGNPVEWIIDVLTTLADFIQDSGLEVILIGYTKFNLTPKFDTKLRNLVKKTAGTYQEQ